MQQQYGKEAINTRPYWDERFITDWNANKGDEQSRWFARIALEHMPDWLTRWMRLDQPAVCDWGCALGDGTEMMQQTLGLTHIAGIDFSDRAVGLAKDKFPDIPFYSMDIEAGAGIPEFDLIFSSNTLEHFRDPWRILDRLSGFATKHLVILIPFEEYSRHFEHFYTFEAPNIPMLAGSRHLLSYSAVIDGTGYRPSYWLGKQILLIYSIPDEIGRLGLRLSDSRDTIPCREEPLNQLSAQLTDLRQKLDGNQQKLEGNQQQLQTLTQELEALRALLFTLQSAHNHVLEEKTATEDRLNKLIAEIDRLSRGWPWTKTSTLKKLIP